MPSKIANLTYLDNPFIGKIEGVGDMTYYNVAVASNYPSQSIYVALGGNYSPKVGGFFPVGTLLEFETAVKLWAYDLERTVDFVDYIKSESCYKYMLGKQLADKPHVWDFIVAFVVAWLFGHGRLDGHCVRIIGALHMNNKAKTRLFLEERVQVWGEGQLATEARELWIASENIERIGETE